MQAESGVNGVAMPIGAPTWPPWVASRALNVEPPLHSGAHSAMDGSHGGNPETVPHASTSPPPVTRHAAMTVVVVVLDEVLLDVLLELLLELLLLVEVLVLVEVEVLVLV